MPDELHRDRARAEGFGAVADDYERWRPDYPAALLDDLAATRPGRVLDVGCGTGKVATGLVRRGLSVLGVEPDVQMARVARRRGVPVEIATFEDWDDAGRRFDLLTCGAVWHWVDPRRGTAKAATVLRPGGTLARIWYAHEVDDRTRDRFAAVHREHAPGVDCYGTALDPDAEFPDPVAASAEFTTVARRSYHEDRVFTADAWLGMLATFSAHQRLAPDDRARLHAALRTVIDADGGRVRAREGVLLLLARRR